MARTQSDRLLEIPSIIKERGKKRKKRRKNMRKTEEEEIPMDTNC